MRSIKDVWDNIMAGRTVYWGNEAYRITLIDAIGDYQANHCTSKNGLVLRVTCTSNWFGSLLEPAQLKDCYTKENY